MPNLSVRGLDLGTLTRIRSVARRRRVSVNRVVVDTLRAQYAPREQRFHDLDSLKGIWSKAQAEEFAAAVAPFGEVDPALWAAEPSAAYRASRLRRKHRTRR